jgi:probable FeS assembly SUF system protein SufT
MHEVSSVTLTRDCEAIRIPVGAPETLSAGTPLDITQTLGGSYTVRTTSGLFRIAAQDADALGLTPPTPEEIKAASDAPVTEQVVQETLKNCYDPEIPVNIVDLGLVYGVQIEPLPTGRSRVNVQMTLTAPGCGMGGSIAGEVEYKLLNTPGIEEAHVQIVWDPSWHQSMISEEGRKILGLVE